MFLLTFFVPSKAQETVTLTFTANTQGGVYCPFNAVNVTNVTRGWTETLAYPDTILVLNSTVGLDEQFGACIHLGKAYPNPFVDETNVLLENPVAGELFIQVYRIDGTEVVASRNYLEAGTHKIKVGLSSPSMAFLVATSTHGRQVVRILCTNSGGRDSITVEPVSGEYVPINQHTRGDATGEFQPGDMMRYTAVLYDGANTVYSNTVTQQQYESQIMTLHFDLTIPEVTTSQVTNITQTTATGVGNVTATGGVSVTERGICWSTSHNPTTSSNHASNGMGTGTYTVQMNSLTAGTTYYVRAYAINRFGTAYGSEESFTTLQIPSYTVSLSANPTNGGTVSGSGLYQQGQSCTVIATAANGYSFTNWTENGSVVSANPNYTFTVNSNRTLVANFSVQAPNTYTINASPNPSDGGTVTGGGSYQQGQSCTVAAVANTGYTFLRWTENGNQVSTNSNYTFTVTGNRTLVAQFQILSFAISATVTPNNSGTVTGGGSYDYGQTCTLTATANSGYVFEKWTKDGIQVSSEAIYSFTVTEAASYVAHFQLQSFAINLSANPTIGGNVTGGGSYNYGQTCTVTATANPGYSFLQWVENGNQVSSNANYTFPVTGNRTLVAQFQSQNYSISVSASPANGGSVSGGGNYDYGQSCTVTATASTGYTFFQWTENGNQVSANANYTFTVTGNRNLVAHFQLQSFIISVSASPANGGSVSGGNTYNYGQSCTVTATTNSGYNFTNWTENGSVVSASPSYTFTVNSNRTLVANFAIIPQAPSGAINGLFSVSSTQQVYFSQGNLQYQASTNTWQFADNQYDYVGSANSNISSSYSGWIDLFAWGTSGYNHGAVCYQPWSLNGTNYDFYYAYGNSAYNLYDQTGMADWGYNSISNGGNIINLWRTLTNDDWWYVFYTRTTASGIRYAKATVNGISGMILLPDDWNAGYYSLNNTNQGNADFSSNVISISQWAALEQHGAVFLPAAGVRGGTSVGFVGSSACYWSASCYTYDSDKAYCVNINDSYIYLTDAGRTNGYSVRLVHDYLDYPLVTTRTITDITQTTAIGGGNVTNTGNSTVTSRGVCWSTSHNPTINGNHTANGSGMGNFTSSITGLTAGTTYYVRAYATNGAGTTYGNEESFTAGQNSTYIIDASPNPIDGGIVTGEGPYQHGQSCTVTATANAGNTFLRWTENGNQVSTNSNYTFTVTGNRNLVAQFQASASIPTVTTTPVTNIHQTYAWGGGNVTNTGGLTVFERGICWSTSHNPTTSDSHGCNGTGTGSFTITMGDLTGNTTYYVRSYAINSVGFAYGNEVSFTTSDDGTLPTVTTNTITNITQTAATGGGNVTNTGGSTVTARGVCWSTSHNPTISGNHTINGTGTGSFTSSITGLTSNTTYFVRAYATNGSGTAYGSEECFTTSNDGTLATVITNPVTTFTQTSALGGGVVTSTGNSTITERGVCWSTSHNPTTNNNHTNAPNGTGLDEFTVVMNSLTANTTYYVRAYATNSFGTAYGNEVSFTTNDWIYIIVSAYPINGGTVNGGGTYSYGQSCTISASANTGYTFLRWVVNGNQVSTNANYTFTVTGNRTLVAQFQAQPQAPEGAINSLFTINADGNQVYFSQGNLQYIGSSNTPYWKFADNQWDYLGVTTGQNSANVNIDRDLFGWGTSGYRDPDDIWNVNYQPWSTSNSIVSNPSYNDYGYGPSTNMASPNLTGSSSNYDWGVYNPIINGGNTTGLWRTMTRAEWNYVFNTRTTSSGIRYAKAQVNNINGIVLLPDDWDNNYYSLNGTNSPGEYFSSNVINSTQWIILEQHGAVFLPAAGCRYGTSVDDVDTAGYYWTASYYNSDQSYRRFFNGGIHSTSNDRCYGYSVRLVQDF